MLDKSEAVFKYKLTTKIIKENTASHCMIKRAELILSRNSFLEKHINI